MQQWSKHTDETVVSAKWSSYDRGFVLLFKMEINLETAKSYEYDCLPNILYTKTFSSNYISDQNPCRK